MAKPTSFESAAEFLRARADARLGVMSSTDRLEVIPTGSVALDLLTGINGPKGIPKGRVTQIASDPGVGKSTTALQIAANCQRQGGKVLYLDFEQALTSNYAEQMGCNLENNTLLLTQPTDLDIAWELIAELSEFDLSLVILDSIASMFPKVEDDDLNNLKTQVGWQARALSLFFPRLKNQARIKNFAALAINQVRAKLEFGWGAGIQRTPAYGDRSLPGGYAAKFNTDLLYYLSIKKTEKVKLSGEDTLTGDSADVYTGTELVATTWKNKVGMPFCKVPMYLKFGQGIDDERSVVELAESQGIIESKRNGVWTLTSDGTFQGVEAGGVILTGRGTKDGASETSISAMLAQRPDVYQYVRNRILQNGTTDMLGAEESAAIKAYMNDDEASIQSSSFAPTKAQ